MNSKVLLVGGCGFIGHNLAIYLKNNKINPIVVDSLSINNLKSFEFKKNNGDKSNQLYRAILNNRIKLLYENNIELIEQDTRFDNEIFDIYNKINPDIVIHLAAVSHANKSNKDPHTTFDNSIRTLENTLEYVRKNKKHLIYISSSMTYGNFDSKEVNEDTICNPLGIYGTLKYCGELIVKSYSEVFDFPFTIIRPSALYGERCVSRRVTQVFIENALTNKEITIMGNGEEKLDFTYINDLMQGIYSCINNNNSINQIFNLTYGNARKINDLIDILREYFPNIKIKNLPRDKLMPERGTLDISKAKKLLSYNPKFSLDNGFRKYIEWYIDFYKNLNN